LTPNAFLITRPLPDAYATQHYLQHLGVPSVIEPLLRLRYLDKNPTSLITLTQVPIQGIILTSRNSVRALHHFLPHCHLPVIAIGERTTLLAQELGFHVAHTALGNSDSLVNIIRSHYLPHEGRFLYFSGDITAYEDRLKNTLISLYYQLDHIPLYHMEAATVFSQNTLTHFMQQKISGISFFSPRTASIFLTLIKHYQLEAFLHFIPAFCLSAEIANTLPKNIFSKVYISETPTNKSLCDLIGNLLRT
jgi:uroporphyrinogen-III synthase